MALFFAGLYLFGGGMGPLVVGLLSDHFAEAARVAAGAAEMNESFKAQGLHDAMLLIPVALLLAMAALIVASRSFVVDRQKMEATMASDAQQLDDDDAAALGAGASA